MTKELAKLNRFAEVMGDEIYSQPIKAWLREFDDSTDTQDAYMQSLLHVFGIMFEEVKTLHDITMKLIKKVNAGRIRTAKLKMKESGWSKTTIKLRVKSVQTFYEFLINTYQFNNSKDRLLVANPFKSVRTTTKSSDTHEYDALTEDEILRLFEVAQPIDVILYKLGYVTGVRISALLRINRKDVYIEDGLPVVHTVDKGGEIIEKAIPWELYSDILEVFLTRDKLFDFTRKTALNRLKGRPDRPNYVGNLQRIGITKEEIDNRPLVFHSIKKTTVTVAGINHNGNPLKMKEAGNHHNTDYATGVYDKSIRTHKDDVSLTFNLKSKEDREIELKNLLDKLEKKELIELVLSTSDQFKNTLLNGRKNA